MQNYPNIKKLMLASASPRRRELLSVLTPDFETAVPDIDESLIGEEKPAAFAERLAAEKADAVHTETGTVLIAADTIVVLGDSILGKPSDEEHAFQMLSSLSDKVHEVITGVCIKKGNRRAVFSVITRVVFRRLEKNEIIQYVASGCPMDKAGAYAIQGGAAHMVREIHGSYTNVVGLPLSELHERLLSF